MHLNFINERVNYKDISNFFDCVENKNRLEVQEKIYILEHKDVYTAGKSVLNVGEALKEKICNVSVVYSDRGGLWTWHGKGQVVVYFVYDLKRHNKTIGDFMKNVENVVVDCVKEEIIKFSVSNDYKSSISIFARQDKRGFWCQNLKNGEIAKFGFIGLRVKNGFVIHGISINYNNDLSYFDFINPCGLGDVKISSIEKMIKEVYQNDLALKKLNIENFKKRLGNALFNALNE